MIKIRKTQPTDIAILMDIFEQAKHIMRKDGNMLQWRGNYPSREIVIADIEQGNSYVCTDDTEEIIGTFAFIRGNDPTYTHIYEGKWVEDTLPYGVIHRLASTEHSKGVANACLQWCYEQIPNLRADTHRDNHILQYILKKHGFKYCGKEKRSTLYEANKTQKSDPDPGIDQGQRYYVQGNFHSTEGF